MKIALIDIGVDMDHPDLKGQIEYSQNFAPEPPAAGFTDVHGTAVAGILSEHDRIMVWVLPVLHLMPK